MKRRYEARWICAYMGSEDDHFDPDLYHYKTKYFPTLRAADRYAEEQASKGPCGGWWEVIYQEYNPNYYERGVGDYEDLDRWVEGIHAGV